MLRIWQLVFVNPDFSKYVKAAAATRAIFSRFDPDFEAGSLDEAYLDITDYCREHDLTGAWVTHATASTWPGLACMIGLCMGGG